ncbi:type II 3-dehydroquinate dehydratase [Collinsella sp. zg1085]|uniref:type II 3-dehydroquinate dehydratase n=1 Tax=Collinsella sp. zg1085 TaxID=2844380 RepID=UPI001C0E484C|nr:type II 3-dehydroquinate dehydratase [Collinsella sp. zg1085]QWT17074.1 type II 3-dehydroquinate dehydratase [Collinsella sp. zg1085]
MKVLILNGPNINMLGTREPNMYGHNSYEDLVKLCQNAAEELGFTELSCIQTNHEGALVDAIQEAYGSVDGIIINPAAYTHTSIAILDALKAVDIPAVEVHISDVSSREAFRQVSYAGMACFAHVIGEGIQGYVHALKLLKERLAQNS